MVIEQRYALSASLGSLENGTDSQMTIQVILLKEKCISIKIPLKFFLNVHLKLS